jgi:hypothetical protein
MAYELKHEGRVIQRTPEGYQTRVRGSNESEYEIYLAGSDDGNGMDICTGGKFPLKTYDEWLGNNDDF